MNDLLYHLRKGAQDILIALLEISSVFIFFAVVVLVAGGASAIMAFALNTSMWWLLALIPYFLAVGTINSWVEEKFG